MMKRILLFTLMILLVGGLTIGEYIDPEPAQAVELKYASMNPTTAWIHPNSYVPWAEKVKEATNGRVTVKIYPAQTLGKAPAFFDLVKSGIADIALGVQVFNPGQFPLTDIMSLPFMDIPNAAVGSRVLWELYEKFPEIQKEYAGIKLLHFVSTDPYFIVTTKKQIRTLEDMKGVKLRVPGGRAADAIKALGAVPVAIRMPELYVAIEKGVIDGAPIPGEPLLGQLPVDKLKYAIMDVKLWTVPFWVGMNERTWDRLSKADQEAIMSVSGLEGSIWFGKTCFDDSKIAAMKVIKEKNIKVTRVSPQERERWVELAKPIHKKYIADLEAKGLPARKVYEEANRLLKKYSQ